MFFNIGHRNELSMLIASVSGSFFYILNRRDSNISRQLIAFFISFSMGLIGADMTLAIIKEFIPAAFKHERMIGAFVCSALVVNVMTNIMKRIEIILKGGKGDKEENND